MSSHKLLKRVQLFAGLKEPELEKIAAIAEYQKAEPLAVVIHQNTTGSTMYVVAVGSVEVFIEGYADERSLVVLGQRQVFGEMSLVDYGYRSASVRATEQGCEYFEIEREAMEALCQENEHIGYIVMRNLAADLAFKLRHRNLTTT